MNFRLPVVLFGSALVIGVVLLVVSMTDTDEKPPPSVMPELTAAKVKADEIDEVEIEKAGAGTLKLRKEGGTWVIAEPVRARADAAAVDGVVSALLRAAPTSYPGLGTNPAVHGLSPATLKVTLRQGSERSATLNLGDVTLGRGDRAVVFVSTGAKPDRPLAVRKSDLTALFREADKDGPAGELAKWVPDYRSKQVFTPDATGGPEQIQAVRLTSKGKTLVLEKNPDGWLIKEPNLGPASPTGDPLAADKTFTGVRPLVTGLLSLHAVEFIENPGDPKQYGLDDPVEAEVTLKDGKTKEKVRIGKKVDGSPTQVYVQIGDEKAVAKATGEKRDELAAVVADPGPLRDRTLVHSEDRARIDAIDLTAHGSTTKLRKPPAKGWTLYGGPGDPKAANDAAVNKLLDVITQPKAVVGFPDPKDAAGPVPDQQAEVKVYTGALGFAAGDPKAEPAPKGNPVVLQFGRKGDQVYVRRTAPNGTKADFLLPRELAPPPAAGPHGPPAAAPVPVIDSVAKSRLDLLSPHLEKSFAEASANRLTVAHGTNVVLEVERGNPEPPLFPTGKWTFVKPDSQKGQTADLALTTELLDKLARLEATKYVDEQADEKKLAGYGLDPKAPRVRVTVGLKGEADKERVYEFGTDAPGGVAVYARQGGSQLVFTVPKAVADPFLTPDLRDRTVVRFDTQKVKRVKVRGWKEATGQVLTREFERKDAGWVAVDPKDYPVDPGKVEAFLRDVAGLRVKGYLPKPAPPQYGLAADAGGTEVTLVVDGGPEIQLNVGSAIENGASRVASLGVPPNEAVFTLAPDVLKPYRENAGSFAK